MPNGPDWWQRRMTLRRHLTGEKALVVGRRFRSYDVGQSHKREKSFIHGSSGTVRKSTNVAWNKRIGQ